MKKLCLMLLFIIPTCFAAQTTLHIVKSTTLTGNDATRFIETFGPGFKKRCKSFYYKCDASKPHCVIRSKHAGFTCCVATQLLAGRDAVMFESEDKTFLIRCGQKSVEIPNDWCNITQQKAVLA